MAYLAAIFLMDTGGALVGYALSGNVRPAAAAAGVSWFIIGLAALMALGRGHRGGGQR